MNEGIISRRYASALLKYVAETGNGEKVYDQVCVLSQSLNTVPHLRYLIDNPSSAPGALKTEICEKALGGEMADEIKRLVRLVIKNRRTKYLRAILFSFMEQYRKMHRVKVCSLVTAVPDEALENKLISLVKQTTGESLLVEHRVDPEIIGGFIFEIDGNRMDASVLSQIKAVRRQFMEKNRRIV